MMAFELMSELIETDVFVLKAVHAKRKSYFNQA